MKKTILITFAFCLFAGISAMAQRSSVRIGYVDMEYILENVPEYQEATAQLEKRVQQWKTEIETELKKIEDLKRSLNNERPLLTDELIEEREEEIRFQEQKILGYQQKRFGPNGDLIIQKLQLIKPIQDQVFIAVQEIAKNRGFDMIFNKSADIAMLYVAEELDISDQVLRSIQRASNREQLNSRQEKQELLRDEEKTVEESEAVTAREAQQEDRATERAQLIAERKRTRDSLRTAKKEAYEARRAKILKERQRKKDSIANARENKDEIKQEH